MKNFRLSLLVLPAILLCSCNIFSNAKKTYEKEIEAFDIDTIKSGDHLSNASSMMVKARFVEGEDYVPYLTLSQYIDLYRPHFASDVKVTSQVLSGSSVLKIEKSKQPFFIAEIDYKHEAVLFAGNLQAGFDPNDDPRDLTVLSYGIKNQAEAKLVGSDATAYSALYFGDYDIYHFSYNNDHYYPLGFLDITFSNNSSIYFTYNYKHIYSTRTIDNYSGITFIEDNKEYTFDFQMKEATNNEAIPSYLIKYNSGLFLYLMDNLYGLKDAKNISSFASYYRQRGIYNNLYSADNITRGYGYSDALSVLDDNHTLLVSANETWGENPCGRQRRYGDGCHNRAITKDKLTNLRKEVLPNYKAQEDIIYSQDGTTALFSFDSFVFGTKEQVFNSDGSISENAKKYDTYYMVLDALKQMSAKGTVKNVIFDISLNGGGTVGVLLKILTLISKDNNSTFTFFDNLSKIATIYSTQIDSNNDGLYDTKDCFGNQFNFYILTSDCSFSCGNAFPCLAQNSKDAKIIGQKSGGGECAVAIHYLPNSEYVYHSSTTHIGFCNENYTEFYGVEGGAKPDIEIPIGQDFYSIEALNRAIKNA